MICGQKGQQVGLGIRMALTTSPTIMPLHCQLIFLVWAVGDYGRQVGNGHWASKHLEYQTYESYQVGAYWFDNIGTCLGTQRQSNFPAYVQKYR